MPTIIMTTMAKCADVCAMAHQQGTTDVDFEDYLHTQMLLCESRDDVAGIEVLIEQYRRAGCRGAK